LRVHCPWRLVERPQRVKLVCRIRVIIFKDTEGDENHAGCPVFFRSRNSWPFRGINDRSLPFVHVEIDALADRGPPYCVVGPDLSPARFLLAKDS